MSQDVARPRRLTTDIPWPSTHAVVSGTWGVVATKTLSTELARRAEDDPSDEGLAEEPDHRPPPSSASSRGPPASPRRQTGPSHPSPLARRMAARTRATARATSLVAPKPSPVAPPKFLLDTALPSRGPGSGRWPGSLCQEPSESPRDGGCYEAQPESRTGRCSGCSGRSPGGGEKAAKAIIGCFAATSATTRAIGRSSFGIAARDP